MFSIRRSLERLERGNSRLGGKTGISYGCRCHSGQNIICEQKFAEARILSLTGSIGDDGVLAASLELPQKNGKKSKAITKLAYEWLKKGI